MPSRISTSWRILRYLRGRRCLRRPAFWISSTKGSALPSRMGSSRLSSLDDGIVHAQADERREQVLGGRDEHAFFHQAGGVADAGHVAADGLDFKAVEIDAAKDDSRSGRSGKYSHGNWRAAVEAYSTAFHGGADCLLLSQRRLNMSR